MITDADIAARARQGADIIRARWVGEDALSVALLTLAEDLPLQKFSASGGYAPGNKPYIAISSGSCEKPSMAIERWTDRLLEYAASEAGSVLWWRAKPMINGEVDCETGEQVWTVYARLAIGDAE